MASSEEPPEKDVKDFEFRQLVKCRVYPSPTVPIPVKRLQLLAVSSKFDIIFTAFNNEVRVTRLATIDQLDERTEARERSTAVLDVPCDRSFSLAAQVVHLGVSCDDLIVSVVIDNQAMLMLLLFETSSLLNQATVPSPFAQHQLSAEDGVELLDLTWNPAFPSLLAVCLSNNAVKLLDVTDSVSVKASASLPASCLSWSPKGKQIMVGKFDGSSSQYDHAMTLKKDWPAPTFFTQPHQVTDMVWVSTYTYLSSYLPQSADPSVQPVVLMTVSSKEGPINYINYDDVCFGSGEERQAKYYFQYIADWESIVMSSCSATETTIIARDLDQKAQWEHWNLEDSSRAELPVTDSQTDSYPVGMCVMYCAQRPLQLEDNKTHPASPVLLLLSTDGLLVSFHMAYFHPKAATLAVPPQSLPAPGTRSSLRTGVQAPVPQASTAAATQSSGSSTLAGLLAKPAAPTSGFTAIGGAGALSGSGKGLFGQPPQLSFASPAQTFPAFPSSAAAGPAISAATGQTATVKPTFGFGGLKPESGQDSSSSSTGMSFLTTSAPPSTGFLSTPPSTGFLSTPQTSGPSARVNLFGAVGTSPATSAVGVATPATDLSGLESGDASSGVVGLGVQSPQAVNDKPGLLGPPPSYPPSTTPTTGATSGFQPSAGAMFPSPSASVLPATGATFQAPATGATVPTPATATFPTPTTGAAFPTPSGAAFPMLSGSAFPARTAAFPPSNTTSFPAASVAPFAATSAGPGFKPSTTGGSGQFAFNFKPAVTVAPSAVPQPAVSSPSSSSIHITSKTPGPRPQPPAPSTSAVTTTTLPAATLPAATAPGSASAGGAGKVIPSLTPAGQSRAVPPVSSRTPAPSTDSKHEKEIDAILDSTIMKNISEEIEDFEKELQHLRLRMSKRGPVVGSKEEMQTLCHNTDKITAFSQEIKNMTKEHCSEMYDLKGSCLDLFAMVEECRCRQERNNDPHYLRALQQRTLDPATARRMRQLRHCTQQIAQALNDADAVLDSQWEAYRQKDKKMRILIPNSDTLYRAIKSNHNVLMGRQHALDRVQHQLEQLQLKNKTSRWENHATPDKSQVNSSCPSAIEQQEWRLKKADLLTPEKVTLLKESLANHRVRTIRCQPLVSLSQSRLVSFKNQLLSSSSAKADSPSQDVGSSEKDAEPERQSLTEPSETTPLMTSTPAAPPFVVGNMAKAMQQPTAFSGTAYFRPRTGPPDSGLVVNSLATGTGNVLHLPPPAATGTGNVPYLPPAAKGTGNIPHLPSAEPPQPVFNPRYETVTPTEYDDEIYDDEYGYEDDEEDEDDDEEEAGFGDQYEYPPDTFSTPVTAVHPSTPASSLLSAPGALPKFPGPTVGRNLFSVPASEASDAFVPAMPTGFGAGSSFGGTAAARFSFTAPAPSGLLQGAHDPSKAFATVQDDGKKGDTQDVTSAGAFGGFQTPSAPAPDSTSLPTPLSTKTVSPAVIAGPGEDKSSAPSFLSCGSATVTSTTCDLADGGSKASSSPAGGIRLDVTSTVSAASPASSQSQQPAASAPSSPPVGFFAAAAAPSSTAPTTVASGFSFLSSSLGGEAQSGGGTSVFGGSGQTSSLSTFSSLLKSGSPSSTTTSAAAVSQSEGSVFGKPVVATGGGVFGTAAGSALVGALATTTTTAVSATNTTATTITSLGSLFGAAATSAGSVFGGKASTGTPETTPVLTTPTTIPPTSMPGVAASTSSTDALLPATPVSTAPSGGEVSSTPSSLFGVAASVPSTAPPVGLFSATADTTPSSTGSMFGSALTTKDPPPYASTAIASPAATSLSDTPTPAAGTSVFGASTPSSGFGSSALTTASGSVFGTASESTTATPGPKFGFGQLSGTGSFGKPAFGSASTFGQSTGFGGQTSTASVFGQTSAAQTSTGSLFGQTSAAQTSTGSLFGQTSASQTSTGSLFGQTSAAQTSTGSLFGQASAAQTSTGSVFGQTGSVFGQTSTAQTSTGSLFGQTGSVFGQTSTAQTSTGSLFGQPSTSSAFGSSAGFGQTATTSAEATSSGNLPFGGGGAGGGVFGLGAKPSEEKAKQNVFGTVQTFGNNPATNDSLFGNKPTSVFGISNSQPTSSGASSVFGSSAFGSSTSSAGGGVASLGFSVTQTSSSAGAFGGSPAFGAGPSFGGSPAFGNATAFGGSPAFGATPTAGSSAFGSSPAFSGSAFGAGQQTAAVPGFGNFASNNAPSFGSLAQSSDTPTFAGMGQTAMTGGFGALSSQGAGGGFGSPSAGFAASPPGFGGGQQPPQQQPSGFGNQSFGSSPSFSAYRA